MTKIKAKWSDYSLREKIAIILGSIGLCIQVFRYASNTLSENTGTEIFVFGASCLLLFAPLVIVELIKKRKSNGV